MHLSKFIQNCLQCNFIILYVYIYLCNVSVCNSNAWLMTIRQAPFCTPCTCEVLGTYKMNMFVHFYISEKASYNWLCTFIIGFFSLKKLILKTWIIWHLRIKRYNSRHSINDYSVNKLPVTPLIVDS